MTIPWLYKYTHPFTQLPVKTLIGLTHFDLPILLNSSILQIYRIVKGSLFPL